MKDRKQIEKELQTMIDPLQINVDMREFGIEKNFNGWEQYKLSVLEWLLEDEIPKTREQISQRIGNINNKAKPNEGEKSELKTLKWALENE